MKVKILFSICFTVLFFWSSNLIAGYYGPTLKIPMEEGGDITCLTIPGSYDTHEGNGYYSLDFNDRCENQCTDEKVLAAAAGKVIALRNSGCVNYNPSVLPWPSPYECMGCYVKVQHSSGYSTVYMHLQAGSVDVAVGDHVVQGQLLGYMGNTGLSSGIHLHFGVQYNDSGALSDELTGVKVEDTQMVNYQVQGGYGSTNYDPDNYFVYPDEGFICFGPVKYDANWTASCEGKSDEFPHGYKIQSLFEIMDISEDFRFKVETWNVGATTPFKYWEWSTDWTEVNGNWSRAYFAPGFYDTYPTDWEFRIFVDVDNNNDNNWIHIDTEPFTVTPNNFYYDMYQYNGPYWGGAYDYKAYNCTGPIVGGSQTNWEYSCGGVIIDPFTILSSGSIIRSDYTIGDEVFGLVKARNITEDFRFTADVYRNGVWQSEIVTDWSYVENYWDKAFFWPWAMPQQTGNWEFVVYLDEYDGPETYLDTLNFIVWPNNNHPFYYQRNGTACSGPVTGGAETNWWYTCENPNSKFTAGETVYALAHVQNIYFNHRYKVEAYKNDTYQWAWTTNWIQVEPYTWQKSFFMPTLSNSTAGAWQFKIFIELADGGSNGFRQIDTINFDVL